MKRWLLIASLGCALTSLTCGVILEENPDYCENDFKCLTSPGGPICDVAHHRCVAAGSLTRLDTIAPTSGKRSGGTVLTLTGLGFTPNMKLRMGDQIIPTTYVSPTELTAQSPLAPPTCGPVNVQLQSADNLLVMGQLQYFYRHINLAISEGVVLPTVSPTARAIASGFIDGDDNLDLITANQVVPGLSIFAGQPGGTFAGATTISGQGYFDVKLADVDGSGEIDILAKAPDQVDFFRGRAFPQARTAFIDFPMNGAFTVGDLNIGAGSEVVVVPSAADKMSGHSIAPSATSFATPAPNLGLLSGGGLQVIVDDLNGDGIGDIAAGMQNGAVLICLGQSNQNFMCSDNLDNLPGAAVQLASLQVSPTGPRSLFVLSASAASGALFIVQGTALGSLPTPFASFANAPKIMRLEDYDCDGNKDIIVYVATENQLRIFLNQGNGSFDSTPVLVPLLLSLGVGLVDDVTSMTFGDWNKDGSVDLALLKAAVGNTTVNGLFFLNKSR